MGYGYGRPLWTLVQDCCGQAFHSLITAILKGADKGLPIAMLLKLIIVLPRMGG